MLDYKSRQRAGERVADAPREAVFVKRDFPKMFIIFK
jgi:hypothetical protein